jgi:hypothetical protein
VDDFVNKIEVNKRMSISMIEEFREEKVVRVSDKRIYYWDK